MRAVANGAGRRTDHADLDVVGEVTRGLAIMREDASAVAVFVGINQVHRGLHAVDPYHLQHRAEDLFLVAEHVRANPINQRATNEETVFMPHHLWVAAVDHDSRTLRLGTIDVADYLLLVGLGDYRTSCIGQRLSSIIVNHGAP